VDRPIAERCDAQKPGELFDSRLPLLGPSGGEPVADVSAHGEVGKQMIGLVDEPDAARLRCDVGHVAAIEHDAAAGEPHVSRDGFEQAGLSQPVGPMMRP
jgi:hypothetical protein